ncbi:hypothetical protein H4I96_12265 [Botrytis cinerea]
MVRVAVAGGTGGVGYAIVDALKAQTEHEFIVLSRTLNLVRGAAGSQSVKRFVPSEYGSAYEEKHALARPSTGLKAVAVKELAKTHLEYTSFVNGLFLDYLCMPAVPSHLAAGIRFFDIPAEPRDVGRFVVASLSLPKWENRSFIVGDRQSWHDPACTGEKWTITDEPSKILSGQVIEAPAHRAAYSASLKEHGDWFESGTFSFDPKAPDSVYLNELFPEIIPLTVEDGLKTLISASSS